MATRTTERAVKQLLGSNYGADNLGNEPSLRPYIETAAAIVARVIICASRKKPVFVHTAVELELIERWLAAHFYTRMDPTYTSRTTASASGAFTSPKDDTERYRQSAIEVDTSGCLKAILYRLHASATWLGKPVSEQTPYRDRD